MTSARARAGCAVNRPMRAQRGALCRPCANNRENGASKGRGDCVNLSPATKQIKRLAMMTNEEPGIG
jgi:hypothetical protein